MKNGSLRCFTRWPFFKNKNISVLFYFQNMSLSTSHLSKCGNESTKSQKAVLQNGFMCLPLPLPLPLPTPANFPHVS